MDTIKYFDINGAHVKIDYDAIDNKPVYNVLPDASDCPDGTCLIAQDGEWIEQYEYAYDDRTTLTWNGVIGDDITYQDGFHYYSLAYDDSDLTPDNLIGSKVVIHRNVGEDIIAIVTKDCIQYKGYCLQVVIKVGTDDILVASYATKDDASYSAYTELPNKGLYLTKARSGANIGAYTSEFSFINETHKFNNRFIPDSGLTVTASVSYEDENIIVDADATSNDIYEAIMNGKNPGIIINDDEEGYFITSSYTGDIVETDYGEAYMWFKFVYDSESGVSVKPLIWVSINDDWEVNGEMFEQ